MEEPLGSPPAALSALEKNVAELTVMDVYDIASLVGHEFERVIDQHGCEAIARLMPKVVRVLEILEVLVSRHHVAPELDELRLELDRLRVERMDRIEKERKHQKVGGGLSLPVRARGSDSVGAIRFWAAASFLVDECTQCLEYKRMFKGLGGRLGREALVVLAWLGAQSRCVTLGNLLRLSELCLLVCPKVITVEPTYKDRMGCSGHST